MCIADMDNGSYRKLVSGVKQRETFSDMVIRLARESGLTSPEIYRKAGIDAKLYSKIISGRNYQPSKDTALALAIAFGLDIRNTERLLQLAGFSFNPTCLFDVAVKDFIRSGIYDRAVIDSTMARFGLPPLPSKFKT
ncbi:MAG: helix-turn-helix transcriptional regulator [Spirochaetales bacterium]|nr:helix-turn-helix transcriptional regulator [Spirochaetales bacterium]